MKDEKKEVQEVIDFISNHPWEGEIIADEQKGLVSSIDIIDEQNERILTATVMEKKDVVLFTVESLKLGKKQRGRTGTLINDLPHSECIKVVEMFCHGDHSSINEMENAGVISKLLRRIIYLFADDDWHKEK